MELLILALVLGYLVGWYQTSERYEEREAHMIEQYQTALTAAQDKSVQQQFAINLHEAAAAQRGEKVHEPSAD
jgi:hypothetical protein